MLLAIVAATERMVTESYGGNFHVLMWEDEAHRHFDSLVKGLRDRQINLTPREQRNTAAKLRSHDTSSDRKPPQSQGK